MRDHPVLELLHAAAELDQFGAQARIVGLPHIAGDEVIGQPQRGRDREQRAVLERLVAAADIGGARELHVLAGQQHLQGAGLEAGHGRPSGSASASPIIGSSGAVLVMKPANIAAVFFRSSSASSY